MTTLLERSTALKQSKTALHVEDDREWKEMVSDYLKEAGFDVTQTDNQQEAEEHAQRHPFDVYVFDGQFPLRRGGSDQNGSGINLYDKVRQQRGTDIIVLLLLVVI